MMLPALKTSPDGNVAAVLQAHADYLKMVAPSFACSLCSASCQQAPRDCVEHLSPARSSAFDRCTCLCLHVRLPSPFQYTKYVSDYTPALQTVSKLYKREGFARMIKKQRELPAAEGLDLMRYTLRGQRWRAVSLSAIAIGRCVFLLAARTHSLMSRPCPPSSAVSAAVVRLVHQLPYHARAASAQISASGTSTFCSSKRSGEGVEGDGGADFASLIATHSHSSHSSHL